MSQISTKTLIRPPQDNKVHHSPTLPAGGDRRYEIVFCFLKVAGKLHLPYTHVAIFCWNRFLKANRGTRQGECYEGNPVTLEWKSNKVRHYILYNHFVPLRVKGCNHNSCRHSLQLQLATVHYRKSEDKIKIGKYYCSRCQCLRSLRCALTVLGWKKARITSSNPADMRHQRQ
jgi:hypothetical protein